MDPSRHVRVQTQEGVLTITLDRPEVLNAVNARMARELTDLLRSADEDDAVRVVLLTGAGRGFCAGADVGDLAERAGGGRTEGPAGLRQGMRRGWVRLATTLLELEKPVVAAVNGPCAGAGIGLALSCDIVVASTEASFSVAFVKRGLVPDAATTFLLPRLVGLRVARELCLLGDRVDAAEAGRLGLVTRVVPADALMETANDYARRLADGAGAAQRLTKRLLQSAFEHDVATALDREFTAQAICLVTDDAREGATAFLEKRPPRFTGR